MIKKEIKKLKDGTVKTYIKVVEGYRPGPKMPPKQRTIKSFGYLEDQDDPIAFMRQVSDFDQNRKKEVELRIPVPSNAVMYQGNNRTYNYGFRFLTCAYKLLDLDGFFHRYTADIKLRARYSLSDIFQFLVISRILNPDSKRADIQRKELYYGLNTEFELEDIYRSLDIFFQMDTLLQKHLHEKISQLTGRDLSLAFYDVTNYYTEIDCNDAGEEGLRKRGVSKEHRVDPIVQMGLFMDSHGIPVSMKIFPGNTSDSVTLLPVLSEIKKTFQAGRIIVVADKGLNSGRNLDELYNHGDGFVFSQILRGTKGKRYHEKLFSNEDWTVVNEDYRYKLFDETFPGHDKDGKPVQRTRRVLLYYSGSDARMAKKKRAEKLEKAEKAARNNVYGIPKGVDAYLKKNVVDATTGELLSDTSCFLSVDQEKAEKDALFDGYFCLVTSELSFGAQEIRKTYSGLWRIEQSFRILKTDLNARPIYLRKPQHIQAHFLVCYTALLIVRLIQYFMGDDALPPERMARALNAAVCEIYPGGVVHLRDVGGMMAFNKVLGQDGLAVQTLTLSDQDETANDYRLLQKYFHSNFFYVFPKLEVFNHFLSNLSLLEHNKFSKP